MATQHLRFVLAVLGPLLAAQVMVRADPPKSGDKPATQQGADSEAVVKKITLAEFDAMRAEKDTVVLDVRTPREFAAGHVPGAINIDWHLRDFNEQTAKLDKSKKFLVHCMAGGRSTAATNRMNTLGFTHVFNFTGGWLEYSKASKPVEK